jgi:hypothetical protein
MPPYQSLGATGRQFQFKKRTQPFIRTHDETLWEIHPVAAEKQRRLLEMTPAKNAPVSA